MTEKVAMTEKELRTALEEARVAYHEGHVSGDITVKDARVLSKAIHSMSDALSNIITKGAKACAKCGSMPHGFLRHVHPEYGDLYEIGCLVCKPVFSESPEKKDGVDFIVTRKHSQSANGATPGAAVEKWNAENFRVKAIDFKEV